MITCTFEKGHPAHLRHAVVHAIAEKDGAILLVKRAPGLTEGGKWSLPSGFMDRGETGAGCVVRELKEETGWDATVVGLFRLITSPRRRNDERQNVALVYLVTATAQTGTPDGENTDLIWAKLATLEKDYPLEALAFDHGQTVGLFLGYRRKKFPLPIID